ncbi:MAG: spermidine/putrescine ABC transporter substrate-binding protein [Gemmatimonadota bacterium]|nr:spermidine/putrescine ABC transporter substrate-binding protein [Gemmatimonadota bacterium]
MRISNWPLYVDSLTPRLFTRDTGIRTEYVEDVSDNNAYYAKIADPLKQGQSIDRDVVVLTDWMVTRLIRMGYCAPLDDARFPNKTRLVDDFRNVAFDPGRKYSVPWMSGMTGLAYNRALTGRDLTSMRDLFDPAFRGRVTMQTEVRDTLGLILLYQGVAPEHATDAQVAEACALVDRYRRNGQVRAFTGSEYAEDLASGNVAIAIGWSGDIAGLAGDNLDLRFVVPEEGGLLFSDCMFIPVTSHRVPQAMAWMNYVYQPEVSARIVEATEYISPVVGTGAVLAHTDPALASNPLVNPPAELRARLHDFRPLSDDEERRYTEWFYQAMGV